MKEHFAKTKNGVDVYLDTEHSHALTHFAHHPKLVEAAKNALAGIEAKDDVVRFEQEMDEVVGMTDLVETTPDDEVLYALRPLRSIYSRFVKNRKSQPTRWIVVDLRKDGDAYVLRTAFVGRMTPSFPGGDYLSEQSREFWANHALVWESQEIVPGSETTECPW